MKRSLLHVLLLLPMMMPDRLGAQTSHLVAVEENGPRAERINLVFLSEGYTEAELPNFANDVTQAVSFLFTHEPWQQYRSYCNIYRIEVASNQSGCDYGSAGVIRDTYFSSGFNTPSVPQLLTLAGTGGGRAYDLLDALVPEFDVTTVLVNDTKYGGSGGSIAVASVNWQSAAIVEHEIGHSFAGLADEYDVDYPIYTPYELPNNTAQTSRALVRWNYWIDDPTPAPTPETADYDSTVGLFEGSMYRTTGWSRPHYNSLMRSLNRPCGAVNREQFVLQYYSRLSPVEGASPATAMSYVTSSQTLDFTVTPKVPSSGVALATTWKIDGNPQPLATSNTFNPLSDLLGNGVHTVSATVRDPTPFVRFDPSKLLEQVVTWNLTLTNQLPNTAASWLATYGSATAAPANDGLQNLVKYALALNPALVASLGQHPTASTAAPYLTLNVPRRTKRTDVDYIVEVSSDLTTWSSGPDNTVTLQDDDTLLAVRDATPISGTGRRFIRLKIQER